MLFNFYFRIFTPYYINMGKTIEKEIIEKAIFLLKNGKTAYSVAKELQLSNSFVSKIAKENLIKLTLQKDKCFVKLNPFIDLNDEIVQYWLGFLTADGYVSDNRISLSLNIKDLKSLENFKLFLNSELLQIRKSIHHKKYEMCSISFRNKQIYEFLANLGFNNKKTFEFNPNFQITWNYLRGLIDGDGYISSKRKEISFINGSQELIFKVIDFLTNENIKFSHYHRRNIHEIRISSKSDNINLFIEKLYKNASVFMERKQINALQIRENLLNKNRNSGN